MTVAGLAPAMLVGCAVHDSPRSAAYVPVPQQVVPVPAPPPAPTPPPPEAPAGLLSVITDLERRFDGVVGIAVNSVDDGWKIAANGDRRLPQQSVSKLWVAMTVLDYRDQGRLSLDDPYTVTKADLTVFHQPIATLIGDDGYPTTIRELLRRAMTSSDNTCNDILLRYVGGPEAVRDFIARKGLGAIRFGPGERLLQAGTAGLEWRQEYAEGRAFYRARAALPSAVRLAAFDGYIADPPDGATASAIAGALAKLKRGELLSPDSTDWLISTMESSRTGRNRLRGAVPAGWSFGHKTGTGQDFSGRTAGYNDVGILTAPDGKTYTVAVLIGDTARTIRQRQELMQAVVASVVANHR
ncbi:class A beta-lactamase [Stakelama tenebrarum]|uniref:beta-lactamase n=1 Tax=Stakelama tenebrarum TaxID=2711215 RepID=A0A6G6Y1R2_9SPHN|nr:class A beta-lactamase [Sphingosinithalassobacter tenebrarum]QIG78658.1 class A beta-lactamase [Sphingosinithalassobacter tenebrarum]